MAIVYSPAGTKCTAVGDLLKTLKKSGWTAKEPAESTENQPKEDLQKESSGK